MSLTNVVLSKKWLVGSMIGEGACGKVYEVSRASTSVSKTKYDFNFCVKIIPMPVLNKNGKLGKSATSQKRLSDTLFYEYTLLSGLLAKFPQRARLPDISSCHGVDTETNVRYLVMEKLDMDLMCFARTSPAHSAVAKIGEQILEGLQWLHGKGFLFIDVKPENFMLRGDKVVFIDYGLMDRWASPNGHKPEMHSAMVGTAAYASLSVQRNTTAGRRDDIEALGYVLLAISNGGELPWSRIMNEEECLEMKRTCDIETLAAMYDCPEVGQIIVLCRALLHNEKPDYANYQDLLANGSGISSDKRVQALSEIELRHAKRAKKENQ